MSFSHGDIAQVGKFGIVGVLNTLLDFAIFNLLTGTFKVRRVPANITSTTVAMIFSFVANREAVFHAGSGDPLRQAVTFFVVTGFGLWVLQTGILHLLADRWKWPTRHVQVVLRVTGLHRQLTVDFTLRNAAKMTGTVVTLIWNFFMYKYVVFS